MIAPELRSLDSPDLERPQLPADPDDCAVAFEATIGPSGSPGAEIFAFTVVTPTSLARETRFRWGRGLLIVPRFSWEAVDLALARLLAHAARQSWVEVAQTLNQNLHWEFDNYRPHPST
jgi:hypothetical protein